MKFSNFLKVLFLGCSSVLWSCGDDEPADEYEYHAHIHHPADAAEFVLNDTLDLEVTFESHTSNTIHHINVEIIDVSNNVVLYDAPASAHVHDTDGTYDYDDFVGLNTANGYKAGGTYKLTAKVWGPVDGESEVSESVQFKIKN